MVIGATSLTTKYTIDITFIMYQSHQIISIVVIKLCEFVDLESQLVHLLKALYNSLQINQWESKKRKIVCNFLANLFVLLRTLHGFFLFSFLFLVYKLIMWSEKEILWSMILLVGFLLPSLQRAKSPHLLSPTLFISES